MFKNAIVGVILTCAACCAVPLLIPALAGASLFGFQLFQKPLSLDAVLCALVLAALAFMAAYAGLRFFLGWRRKNKPACAEPICQSDGKCGCKTRS